MPVTASYALRGELCTYYGGESILHKHAVYSEFRQIASADEMSYFTFATVRNPLDVVVSRYCKLKSDHKGVFSDPLAAQRLQVDYHDYIKYKFIHDTNATFEMFFLKYYSHRPYGDMIDLESTNLDFVIRYERLQEDFAEVLRLLGLKQVRSIPVINKTLQKRDDWQEYYKPDLIPHAKRTFGPFMKKWGYHFPPSWGNSQVTLFTKIQFHFLNFMRAQYHRHLRYNNKIHARTIRRLRARLLNF
jgi:hypothetical protein